MNFCIKHHSLDDNQSDCIIVGIFENKILSCSAKKLDTKSNGYIMNLLESGDISGKIGHTLLIYNIPNVTVKRILLVGCGGVDLINKHEFKKILKHMVKALKNTVIKKAVCCLSELNIKKNNIYWTVRIIINSITESLYKTFKLGNTLKEFDNLNEIILSISNKNDVNLSNVALQHGLAISKSVEAAKKMSNLPPNICNPLYLFLQSKKLESKYKNNIVVESVNSKEMSNLGMNAYVAVGKGSKNKPLMSIIKYSAANFNENKPIALVGKGLTFDSGGISIKSSEKMNEMKYDMCGAAAVYGCILMAAKLKLPLTIIGFLAGCENMLSSKSFRPGDILKTMSGQTVEILNTDAEGRLVLCDVLTYLNRFSPLTVIDIATLTGACVTALGDCASGLFSNDDSLADELNNAANQTDDKIWRLPLFSEYQKSLHSNFADFSNVGDGKAGAITAACFLSRFTQNYSWAHLDIAGTAWKSSKNAEATGRPVELLCQFLLNRSNYIN
ncbi:leucyl aminopeptidase [Buchnera aphidicola (Muscaphis stroyani)]|uniref:Probable cytosol aminopeptidase n=1 Tax=Buchnera aphidicola (Muscaphis stroyani) TaxID=1241869 RepID=A0A4D6Y638_9GAMM|nr:leucyl aminopeptidase [Buchnera aphidicola (Muscaphis stroyani)]